MDNFKPAQPSKAEKILLNPIFHVFIISIVVAAIFGFIRQRQKEELRTRAELLNAGPIVMQKSQNPSENLVVSTAADAPDSNLQQGNSATVDTPATESSEVTAASKPALNSALSSAESGNPEAGQAAALQRSKSIPGVNLIKARMVYVEVDRSIAQAWLREIKSAPGYKVFDNVSMGNLSQISQKLRQTGVRILQQTEYNIRQPQVTHDWFLGTHKTPETENEIGFFSSLNINDQHDGLARGDIEIQRAFRDPGEAGGRNIERISFGGPFEIGKETGFMMHGLLPSRYATEIEDDANPDPLLSIFKSRKFINEESDFIFILDFDSSMPAKQ